MTQLIVTLDDTQPLQGVRDAIKMLRGVISTAIVKHSDSPLADRQKEYVRDSLSRAVKEVRSARKDGRELQSIDDFINEMKKE